MPKSQDTNDTRQPLVMARATIDPMSQFPSRDATRFEIS
jgi:hypothetical protein